MAIGISVYLLSNHPPAWLVRQHYLVYLYFGLIAVTAFVVLRVTPGDRFRITPLDYLVLIIALIIGLVPDTGEASSNITWMGLQMIILFYACELIIQRREQYLRGQFNGALFIALLLITIRGLV